MPVSWGPIECWLVDKTQKALPNDHCFQNSSNNTTVMTTSAFIVPGRVSRRLMDGGLNDYSAFLQRFDLQWKSIRGKPLSAWCDVFWETRRTKRVRVCGTWMDAGVPVTQTRSTYKHMDKDTQFEDAKGLEAPRWGEFSKTDIVVQGTNGTTNAVIQRVC